MREQSVRTLGPPSTDLEAQYRCQAEAFGAEGSPNAPVRRNRIDRLVFALVERRRELTEAANADFGNRPEAVTTLGDILYTLAEAAYVRRSLARWMRPRRLPLRPRQFALGLTGARIRLEPHPLGVVGVIAPWNVPIFTSFAPTIDALAAGNRVMIKVSELTPRTAKVMHDLVAAHFDPAELQVILGDAEAGAAFAALPFDHLVFTGSTAVGRKVARAAAANLTPITLELGGKNPAVIAEDADIDLAARRLVIARMINSGQECVCPECVFVPRALAERFEAALSDAIRSLFPTVVGNPNYTSIITDGHYRRIVGLLDEARSKGARVLSLGDAGEAATLDDARIVPPTLVVGASPDMRIYHEEIFGPVLMLLPYDHVDEVIAHINRGPRPLATSWFGSESEAYARFKRHVRSGGVSRNDIGIYVAFGERFGGVGESGTGYYMGRSGFDRFSHLRPVSTAPSRIDVHGVGTKPLEGWMGHAVNAQIALTMLAARWRTQRYLSPTGTTWPR